MGDLHKPNTPYFNKLLRDAFRVTEEISCDLGSDIFPVYNLAPPDISPLLSAVGYAQNVAIAIPGQVADPMQFEFMRNLAAYTGGPTSNTWVTGILAGMIFKIDWNYMGIAGTVAGNFTQVRLMDAGATTGILPLFQDLRPANTYPLTMSGSTGWVKAPMELIVIETVTATAANITYNLRISVLPTL